MDQRRCGNIHCQSSVLGLRYTSSHVATNACSGMPSSFCRSRILPVMSFWLWCPLLMPAWFVMMTTLNLDNKIKERVVVSKRSCYNRQHVILQYAVPVLMKLLQTRHNLREKPKPIGSVFGELCPALGVHQRAILITERRYGRKVRKIQICKKIQEFIIYYWEKKMLTISKPAIFSEAGQPGGLSTNRVSICCHWARSFLLSSVFVTACLLAGWCNEH